MEPGQNSFQTPSPQAPYAQMREAAESNPQPAGPANFACLERDATGCVCLHYRGMRYGVDDYVPESLLHSQSFSPSGTAGEFVCRLMLTRYGYREEEWPALARDFLMTHTAYMPDRSRHKR